MRCSTTHYDIRVDPTDVCERELGVINYTGMTVLVIGFPTRQVLKFLFIIMRPELR